ncbi:S-methyl-5-thioribose-1-phosphate isomerase [Calditerrivibrio nitroreducens]|uniref:Methylthioribose-1-phosphate isomerase n=1 Tax=Calditerrivibrio nitroreducens (strain DSM 19672 / NBRC 101217 / Yu37-1) TaxID=768670 RepID=E4TH38_CALNY|nr:S-methyl-5-thioribose-1-phosphate isomerase [Calditerrivibrio nitroreducens]ADR19836.1 methylthioribose-1-phosphate isomerase [Calditerrivibrio nitroreducens DSM 19672]
MDSHIIWENDKLLLLDQRQLPFKKIYVECCSIYDVAKAIKDMVVRGAPAIGVAAAYGFVLGKINGIDDETIYNILINTRPTAVNLEWALQRCLNQYKDYGDLLELAKKIHEEDISINKQIGKNGKELINNGENILTHCNAGALATGGYGTALGVIRAAFEEGKRIHVYVDETRPYLQGARLTAYELMEDGIDCTLICDNMAGYLMRLGKIDKVIVGADRIASNGDTANKIGTYSIAVLAMHHRIPFYVAAPISTFDMSINDGSFIKIEERAPYEVREVFGTKIATDETKVFNPSFDVTPHYLISGFITEKGVICPPYGNFILEKFNI